MHLSDIKSPRPFETFKPLPKADKRHPTGGLIGKLESSANRLVRKLTGSTSGESRLLEPLLEGKQARYSSESDESGHYTPEVIPSTSPPAGTPAEVATATRTSTTTATTSTRPTATTTPAKREGTLTEMTFDDLECLIKTKGADRSITVRNRQRPGESVDRWMASLESGTQDVNGKLVSMQLVWVRRDELTRRDPEYAHAEDDDPLRFEDHVFLRRSQG